MLAVICAYFFLNIIHIWLNWISIYLKVMFSGRHEIVRDENGKYFIDRDGKYFRFIF